MDEREATEVALRHVHSTWPPGYGAAVTQVEDAGQEWRVFYTSKRFLETGELRDAITGNWPFLVDKDGGAVRVDEFHRRQALGLPVEP